MVKERRCFVAVVVFFVDIAPRAPGHLTLIGDKAPHAIVMRLHGREINVVNLTPETAGLVGVVVEAYTCR